MDNPEAEWPAANPTANPRTTMEKVVVQHALMWRDHHFEDALGGSGAPVRPQFRRERTDLKSDAVATRNPTPQVTEGICSEPHETTEPAATKRSAAGSSGIGVPRQKAAQKTARRGHGWPGGREESGGDRIRRNRVSLEKNLHSPRAAAQNPAHFPPTSST